MVVFVGDVHVACGVEGDARWPFLRAAELRECRRAPVPGVARSAVARDRRDRAAPSIDSADAQIPRVADVQIARGVYGHRRRKAQRRRGGRASVTGELRGTGTDDGRDDPSAGVHPTDPVVEEIGDVEIAGLIGRHTARLSETRLRGRATIPLVAWVAPRLAGRGRNQTRRSVNPADRPVMRIGDVDVSAGIQRESARTAQLCGRGGAAVTDRLARDGDDVRSSRPCETRAAGEGEERRDHDDHPRPEGPTEHRSHSLPEHQSDLLARAREEPFRSIGMQAKYSLCRAPGCPFQQSHRRRNRLRPDVRSLTCEAGRASRRENRGSAMGARSGGPRNLARDVESISEWEPTTQRLRRESSPTAMT